MRIGECFALGFHGYELPAWVRDFEKQFGLGAVILFDYYCQTKKYEMNIESPEQVRRLTASIHALPSKPLVLIDQEGGKVRRLKDSKGFMPLPSQAAFQKLNPLEKYRVAKESYREMRALGIDMNLAPVIDLSSNPENPNIAKVERAYSANIKDVKESVAILAKVAREEGVLLCLKHFPGLGSATVNSHDEFTDLSASHTEPEENLFYDLAPLIPGEAILVGHGVINSWEKGIPISVSKLGIERLRKRLPHALVITDDLQMQGLQFKYGSQEASRLALLAGADLVLIGNNMINQEADCIGYAAALATSMERNSQLEANILAATARVLRRKT